MNKISICLIITVLAFSSSFFSYSQTNDKTSKSDPNVPIFEIKNDAGQTVFAVYPGGVHIFIDDNQEKATGGGFKVGRLGTEKATQGDILTVDPGEVNVFIDDPLKATGGGFKVGRIGTEKAAGDPDNYLTVTPDSTRIYTSETSNKGFAVGKLSAELGTENFLDLTPENYFIGHESGKLTTGTYNLFLGYRAGYQNTTGNRNFFAGYQSGLVNTDGFYNVFIGPETGISNTYGGRNVFIGHRAGMSNEGEPGARVDVNITVGHDNVYIGTRTGEAIVGGEHNTLIGSHSSYNGSGTKNTFIGAFTGFNSSGTHNVFLGVDAGRNNSTGDNNTFLGTIAGNSNSGSNNTFVGYGSGYNNTSGSSNVFLGRYSGLNETGSDRLYIDNSSTSTPLIYGEFNNNRLVINGNSASNSSNRTFYVNGSAGGDGAWFNDSDVRLKTNINTITNALDKVLAIRGVNFDWKDESRGRDSQIGFIAQEVEDVLPEVVDSESDKYSMQYAPITALLVEAIKEQQKEIESFRKQASELNKLKEENKILKQSILKVDRLEKELEELKKMTTELLENKVEKD